LAQIEHGNHGAHGGFDREKNGKVTSPNDRATKLAVLFLKLFGIPFDPRNRFSKFGVNFSPPAVCHES
jgi:hypothetical protein